MRNSNGRGSIPPEERTPRHRLRLRVATGGGITFTVDVSEGGVCTEQMRVLPVGACIEGSIRLDGNDLPFIGQVAWATAGEHRLNQLGRMGIRFDRIDPGFALGLDLRALRMRPDGRGAVEQARGSPVGS
jgi:hypothetical protein